MRSSVASTSHHDRLWSVSWASNMGPMATESLWLGDDEQELWQSLLTIVIALPAALDRQLQRDAGISNFEYSVLARLSSASEATMRLGDLARDCDGALPRLSKVMDRFEARGWVVRRPDPTDGRYTLASLTAGGRKKVVASAPNHVAKVKQLVFEPLTASQRRALGVALARVAGTVRAETEAG
jgi:DNA-binding MarR family transcriptional regulator